MPQQSGSLMRQVGRIKAWVVGFIVWAVLLPVLGLGSDDGSSGSSALAGGGALFLYFLIVDLVRITWRVRVRGEDASRLSAGGKTYAVHRFRGFTHSVDRSVDTRTSVGGSVYTDAMGDVHGRIESNSKTTVYDRFSLTSRSGAQHTVQVEEASVPLGNNQLVTAIWAIAPGRQRGPYFCFVNHSTGQTTWVPRAVYKLIYGASVGLGVLWAFLASGFLVVSGRALGVAVLAVALFWYVAVTRIQAAGFRRVGSKPLIAAVTAAATPDMSVPGSSGPGSGVGAPSAANRVPPPPPPRTPSDAAWRMDPTGRHEFRFWDGISWTADVSDGGVSASDPM